MTITFKTVIIYKIYSFKNNSSFYTIRLNSQKTLCYPIPSTAKTPPKHYKNHTKYSGRCLQNKTKYISNCYISMYYINSTGITLAADTDFAVILSWQTCHIL